MEKTYEIKDASVNHPQEGVIPKQNVIYYDENGNEETRELYTINGVQKSIIKDGYQLK